MIFKTTEDELNWDQKPAPKALRLFVELSDTYRQGLDDHEITITEFIADWRNSPSYHPLGRAVDIRTKDMTEDIKLKMLSAMKSFAELINQHLLSFGEDIQIVEHRELWGKPQEHIHVEQDNRKPHLPEGYKRT